MTDLPTPATPDDEPTPPETASAPSADAAPRPKRRRVLVGSLVTALVVVLGAGGAVTANAHKVVELDVDGAVIASTSFRGSVAGFLEENDIQLGEHDEVVPALDSPLREGEDVSVLRAVAVDVVVDGEQDVLWTTADDAGAALAAFGLENREAQMAVSRSAGRTEIDLPLSESTRLVADGATQDLDLEPGTRLPQALESWGITLADLDEITVTSETDGTSLVTIVRGAVTERVENEAVPHTAREENDSSMLVGTTEVRTEGVDGNIERRYAVTTRDGAEVAVELTSEATTVEMVEQVTAVGTKPKPVPKPAPAPASSSSSGSSSSAGGGAVASGDVWAKLAQCESGGNPSAVSASGKYHGLYQFSVATWQAVGGSGLPSQASAAEQTQRAQALQAQSGWGQWPHCSSKIGVR